MSQPGTYDASLAWRQKLVAAMKAAGSLHSPYVEAALLAIPRERFIPGATSDADLEWVYQDRPLLTKMEEGNVISTSSQPTMMAIMLELMEPLRGSRVLEIGSGTGYNTALLAFIVAPGGRVTGVELESDLSARANENLRHLALDPVARVIPGDGWTGYPPAAPYDRIIVTAQSEEIAPAWFDQLLDGGRLAVPLRVRGRRGGSDVVVFRRDGEDLVPTDHVAAAFIPLKEQRRPRRRR